MISLFSPSLSATNGFSALHSIRLKRKVLKRVQQCLELGHDLDLPMVVLRNSISHVRMNILAVVRSKNCLFACHVWKFGEVQVSRRCCSHTINCLQWPPRNWSNTFRLSNRFDKNETYLWQRHVSRKKREERVNPTRIFSRLKHALPLVYSLHV